VAGPCGEMVLEGDGTGATCATSDGDVLVEGGSSLDRGLVDTLVFPDLVGAAIGCQRSLVGSSSADTNVGLHDVVLNEWVSGPSVDGERSQTAVNLERTRVGDWGSATWVPAYTDDEVLLNIVGKRETIGLWSKANATTGGIVLVVVSVGAANHFSEVAASDHQWVIVVKVEVKRSTFFKLSIWSRSGEYASNGRKP